MIKGFALLATIINYLDRQVLSVVVNSADFQAAVPLTEATYGYVTSAFMLAYALMNGLSGPFIDYVGAGPDRLRLLHALVVAGRHSARLRPRPAFAGLLPISVGRGRSRQLAGGREAGHGMVPRPAAGAAPAGSFDKRQRWAR